MHDVLLTILIFACTCSPRQDYWTVHYARLHVFAISGSSKQNQARLLSFADLEKFAFVSLVIYLLLFLISTF